MSLAVASLNLAVGMMLVISYRRMLITLDEMGTKDTIQRISLSICEFVIYEVNSILSMPLNRRAQLIGNDYGSLSDLLRELNRRQVRMA